MWELDEKDFSLDLNSLKLTDLTNHNESSSMMDNFSLSNMASEYLENFKLSDSIYRLENLENSSLTDLANSYIDKNEKNYSIDVDLTKENILINKTNIIANDLDKAKKQAPINVTVTSMTIENDDERKFIEPTKILIPLEIDNQIKKPKLKISKFISMIVSKTQPSTPQFHSIFAHKFDYMNQMSRQMKSAKQTATKKRETIKIFDFSDDMVAVVKKKQNTKQKKFV